MFKVVSLVSSKPVLLLKFIADLDAALSETPETVTFLPFVAPNPVTESTLDTVYVSTLSITNSLFVSESSVFQRTRVSPRVPVVVLSCAHLVSFCIN